jgi:Tol biopolymer transport system component/flagellar hook assembly protein FlgD
VVPDGIYKIKVFNYEFFVEVDNTPPEANLTFEDKNIYPLSWRVFKEKIIGSLLYPDLWGYVIDDNLKNWTIEYGVGESPESWYKYIEGQDIISVINENGEPITPFKNILIATFGPEMSVFYNFKPVEIKSSSEVYVNFEDYDITRKEENIDWLVGKRLKITATDYAGNKITKITDFLPKEIFVYGYNNINTVSSMKIIKDGAKEPYIGQPDVYIFYLQETVQDRIDSIVVQYMKYWWLDSEQRFITDGIWHDDETVSGLEDGKIQITWDSSHLETEKWYFYRIRFKAISQSGEEYYSNVLRLGVNLKINPLCKIKDKAATFSIVNLMNYLVRLKLQIKSVEDLDFIDWTDVKVWDKDKGDVIPYGNFDISVPEIKEERSYYVRIVGIEDDGTEYVDETKYPMLCPKIIIWIRSELADDCNKIAPGRVIINGFVKDIPPLRFIKDFSVSFNGKRLLYASRDNIDVLFEILKSFSIKVDTSGMPESSYSVIAELNTEGGTTREEESITVDRTLPTAEITYPKDSLMICPIKQTIGNKQWYGIPVEGVADDDTDVKRYELYYGKGKDPALWSPASTTNWQSEQSYIVGYGIKKGQIGFWNVTGLKGEEFSLRLKVFDVAGNMSCAETSFSIDTTAEITYLGTDKPIFSPNGDGVMDELNINYRIDEYTVIDVQVYRVNKKPDGFYTLASSPIRTIVSGFQHLGGTGEVIWDGRDDSGSIVPDGKYGVAVSVVDSCGNAAQKWVLVEVDNTPPEVVISYPQPGQALGNIVEIKGTANDRNLSIFTLEIGEGDVPDTWSLITSDKKPVKDRILAVWNISELNGTWTLRLNASDKVGNQSETRVTIDLGIREDLIKDLRAKPSLFSPNGDGMLDTTSIIYELTDASDILIEISDLTGTTRRQYKTTSSSAGVYTYIWDGLDDQGSLVPDGSYTVKLIATLMSNTSLKQEEKITVVVDTTPPVIDIRSPLDNSYISAEDVYITGTISDENLLEYSIEYEGTVGTEVLDTGEQSQENYTFGVLNYLPEGRYMLNIRAKDLGENLSQKRITFVIDRTPPKVFLDAPKEGEIYGAGKNSIGISGGIEEENIEMYVLRYGHGNNPAQWTELLRGDTLPHDLSYTLQAGKDAGITDGLYTISLYAKDRAGFEKETKVTITVDNTPPEVIITSPKEGNYVKEPFDVTGTVYDLNLDKFTIEISEGECTGAYKWAVIGTSSVSVQDGVLTRWQALPSDGNYCLRVTAVDKLDQQTEAVVNVKIDTHPPASPVLSGEIENKTNARLTWTVNSEPDLVGYNLYRDGQKLNSKPITDIQYIDQGLAEGDYTYTVKAIDRAGWESESSNQIRLKVDLTGPSVRIRSPRDGSYVRGLVDIKGTAFSVDDFKEYRLYIGKGSEPDTWTLLRRSPVPVSYGLLAQWSTIEHEDAKEYSIKLEAEDTVGNINVDRISVVIDNTPPVPPVLLSVVADGADVTVQWQANTEPDLAGYLLYRNDEIANVEGMVIGDLSAYLISDTTYLDRDLPDGRFRYYVVAVDEAGNMSEESNTIEIAIDTHPPHAVIVEPENGDRFEKAVMISADSPDLDISTVQFEYKKASEETWSPLGVPVTAKPYVTYLDPAELGLTYGEYNLRAVATDESGNTDPSPEFITVIYTDITPPEAPVDLRAQTDGGDVTLTWIANTETDLRGYYIYRIEGDKRVRLNTTPLKDNIYYDKGLADGNYTYEVTAVDIHGNESEPSNRAIAKVYAPVIKQPYTPIGDKVVQISGENTEPAATVEVFVDAGTGAMSQGTVTSDENGNFTFNVSLVLGENRITAKATDRDGNKSRVSKAVVVVYNEPPAVPTGIETSVQDYNVTLTWTANTEPDLVGYNVYRNGEKLNKPTVIISGSTSASSSDIHNPPSNAFDSDYNTYWMSPNGYGTFNPVWWEINMSSPELINRIEIYWGSETGEGQQDGVIYAGRDYKIQVWSGYAWITQVKITGNAERINTFEFTPSYRTDKIRIYITDTTDPYSTKQVRISEVRILKDNLVEDTVYKDTDIRDGKYFYTLTAVDYYGFESQPSESVGVTVGDTVPPSPPQGLTATASGVDVILQWTPNTEPDLAGYNIYKKTAEGWRKINSTIVEDVTYVDAGLPNGTYTYRITALDRIGNESAPSNEASATVYNEPPQPPINLTIISLPEGGSLLATWQYFGNAVGYNLYRSIVSGGPYTRVNNVPIQQTTYIDKGLTNGTTYYYVVVAVDVYGNESVYSNEAMGIPADTMAPPAPLLYYPTIAGRSMTVYKNSTDIAGRAEPGVTVELFRNGISKGTTVSSKMDEIHQYSLDDGITDVSLSPDSKMLAYSKDGSIWLMNIKSGRTNMVVQKGFYPIWSPDGNKIAYLFYDEFWYLRIGIYNRETNEITPLTDDQFVYEMAPTWSIDGTKVVFVSNREDYRYNVWIKDIETGSMQRITNVNNASMPMLSPDGSRVAYFEGQELYLVDLFDGNTRKVDSQTDGISLAWSPDSRRLTFVSYRNNNADIFVLDIETGEQMQVVNSVDDEVFPQWSPDGLEIVFMRMGDENSSSSIWSVEISGKERLIKDNIYNLRYLLWSTLGDIVFVDKNILYILYPEGHFRFKDVELEIGQNIFYAIATDASGNISSPSEDISVVFNTDLFPDLEVKESDIYIYPPYPIAGDKTVINVVVWNRGKVDVSNVDVDVYILDSEGGVELIKTEVIPHISAEAAGLVVIEWNSTDKVGDNRVIVVLDPADKIKEAIETNNYTIKEFYVAFKEGIIMITEIDSVQYKSMQDMKIDLLVRNSGSEIDGVMEVWIEDTDGYKVALINKRALTLPYGFEESYSFLWNTGYTYAGQYRVHTIILSGTDIVAENIVSFTIFPDIDIDTILTTDKISYSAGENIHMMIKLKNKGGNYVIPEVIVRVKIIDFNNNELLSEDKRITSFLPGTTAILDSVWNTGLSMPGNYRAVVETYFDGEIISQSETSFRIEPSVFITGKIISVPSVVLWGDFLRVSYTLQNKGNTDATGVIAKILIIDSVTQSIIDTKEEVLDLSMSESRSGEFVFSTKEYTLGKYTVVLQRVYQNETMRLDTSFLRVSDGTPPLVKIVSPEAENYYNSEFDIIVTATDDVSGVDKVEYRIDKGEWKILPLSDYLKGRYSTTWLPVKSDEGIHTIYFRATDRVGNTSMPVSITITIDLTPPDPPQIVSPPDGTFVSSKTVEIKGVAEPGTEIEMGFLKVVTTTADLETGEFSFKDVTLLPGKNIFLFNAKDKAGNVSKTTKYILYLGRLDITKTISQRHRTLVWIPYYEESDDDERPCKVHSRSQREKRERCGCYDRENEDSTVTATKKFIEKALKEADAIYEVVSESEDFLREFRSGMYNTYIIVDLHSCKDNKDNGDKEKRGYHKGHENHNRHSPLHPELQAELAEAVYRGEGVIIIKTSPSELPKLREALGVKFKGKLRDRKDRIVFKDTEITEEKTLEFDGSSVKVYSITGVVSGIYENSGYPAVVLNEYGRGLAVLFTFNPVELASRTEALKMFRNAISQVTPDEVEFYSYSNVDVEISIKAQYADFHIKVVEVVPKDLKILRITEDARINNSTIQWERQLSRDTSVRFSYLVRLPDKIDQYTLSTDVYYFSNEGFRLYEERDVIIKLEEDTEMLTTEIITVLNSLEATGRDRKWVNKALRRMEAVHERIVTNDKDAERNIKDILKAIDSLRKLKTIDIREIRIKMDILLRIWEIQWYLLAMQ